MTLTSTIAGVLLAIPGLGTARNISNGPICLICRTFAAVSRSLQEVIITILLVAMVGFGPLAGFLPLTFATIGFMAKLQAEDIEEMDERQAEAIGATGASWLQLTHVGVMPQVMPRLIGLSLYRLDINFRESAVIGIRHRDCGAGGIGLQLQAALNSLAWPRVTMVFVVILETVVSEWVSSQVRSANR